MSDQRPMAALVGFAIWAVLYRAIDATQLFEVNASFWFIFILFGLGMVVLCWLQDIVFAVTMSVNILGTTVFLTIIVLLARLYGPLRDILPAPGPSPSAPGWLMPDDEPASSVPLFYSSLCYIIAIPLGMLLTFVPFSAIVALFVAIVFCIGFLADFLNVWQFFTQP